MTEPQEEYALSDAIDSVILMHRDAHFGGQFDVMLDYYEKEGRGVSIDIDPPRIRNLRDIELSMQQNLAALMLSGQEAEQVAESRSVYKRLRDVYEKKSASKNEQLIADLILTEEEEPLQEIAAIVHEGKAIVPALLKIVQSEEFHNPLFPGYGLTPRLAIRCLGEIGDKRALTVLFESIGETDFISEDFALDALHQIGQPAKEFLLKILQSKPYNYDNERAAEALIRFSEDQEVVQIAFKILKDMDMKKDLLFATHLALICEGLTDPQQRQELIDIGEKGAIPSMLKQDIRAIAAHWNKTQTN